MSKSNFIQELRDDFIPRVKVMLSKEEDHLAHLLKCRSVLTSDENKFNLFKTFGWPSELKVVEIDSMIDYSQQMIDHLKMRLTEYQNYIKELH